MSEIYSASGLKSDKLALCRILGGQGAYQIEAMPYQVAIGDGRNSMAASVLPTRTATRCHGPDVPRPIPLRVHRCKELCGKKRNACLFPCNLR